jgi:hypothetical protein
MPTPKEQCRHALELLEASIDGCTEAIHQPQDRQGARPDHSAGRARHCR